MSCAELMCFPPPAAGGFQPYCGTPGGHRSAIISAAADVYCSNAIPVSSAAACGVVFNTQVGAGDSRMLQIATRDSAARPQLPSSEFTSSSSSSSSSPLQHHQQPSRDLPVAQHSLSLSSPCAQPPPPQNIVGAATPSSSSSSTSPLLASGSALSPPQPLYFPPPPPAPAVSSAFAPSRTSTAPHSSGTFPFFPQSSPSSPPFSSSSLKTSSSSEDGGDPSVPKKTRYMTASCVVLSYHDKDASSEVDEHFSKALSVASPSAASASACGYGSDGLSPLSRQSSTDSPPMSQRNFPPSFWDAAYHLRQHPYYYPHHSFLGSSPTSSSSSASSGGGFLGATHDPLYPLPSPFLPTLHPSAFPSLHKDPWASFPFTSGSKSTFNYYPYPARTGVSYPDPHAAAGYGSMATGAATSSNRFSSNYGSLLLSTGSGRGGHFPPSATVTSAQCASGDLGPRVTSLGGESPRNLFGSGLDSSAQEAGKDMHWF